jgi:hypothetical protein
MNAKASLLKVSDRPLSRLCGLVHDDRGGSTLEYMLILAVVVIPIGIAVLKLAPNMINLYGTRMADYIALPFP